METFLGSLHSLNQIIWWGKCGANSLYENRKYFIFKHLRFTKVNPLGFNQFPYILD